MARKTKTSEAPEASEARTIDAHIIHSSGEIRQIPVSALLFDPGVFHSEDEADLAREWTYSVLNGHEDEVPVTPYVFERADGFYVVMSWVSK
jgi:hypothetical protein